ncbi:hypothetical protein [Bradyrhizobium elkanii]|uniref:hypothetical protein n=1 Tax=Bradyrhizobium elkanii TaxID=29448 RepID=UPI002226EF8A|nr:hypothetical protein [Bradyrhizobium elkanii]MCW2130166.1 hypothetical protein [Bradyrhizobium elkanii]MCW2167843.1 hypothetical protein [Bradyrhizobium elkanii]
MIWLKRQFQAADFAPYQDRLESLMSLVPTRYAEFLMVSTETSRPLISDYYVGLPDESFAGKFDGFERVAETDLPREIDTFLFGDQTKEPFTSRFKFRHRRA